VQPRSHPLELRRIVLFRAETFSADTAQREIGPAVEIEFGVTTLRGELVAVAAVSFRWNVGD